VNPAPPVITWATPAAITYGTALSTTQLDATANVPGSFVYTPAAGAVLTAGSQTLSVSFTPTDTTDYTKATATVPLTVNPAPLTITASSATMTYGGTVPTITPSYSGFVNGQNASSLTTAPTCTTTATSTSPAGTYPSSCSGAVDPNYSFKYVNGTVTVSALEISPTSVNFGTVYYLGPIVAQFITLTNTGTTPITISSVKITAPGNALGDYGNISFCPPLISATPGTLAAGKSCKIAVGILATVKIFSPTASTATLTITDSAAGSPHSVPLTAQVINPQATLSTTSLTFPAQKVGTSSVAKSVTVTNTGNTPLTLGNPALTISGNFAPASTTTCSNGGTVAAGASCVINVTFTPMAKGTRTGSVKITDNALSSPQLILLSGTGD
jgi:hypothetical protein